ncbi:unnamed protein product [Caenorhabditis auriculariae]|uniref:ABC transporter domain-containing protein n=1 Tax=Caenorhabditis auriculariae TaxID=2777116 RepID=A0A8S1H496_9PELO|nr:unnamed protein product [Caenorhabditis auriculariae]
MITTSPKPSTSRVEWDLSHSDREENRFADNEDEASEGASTYFTFSRHQEHYFSNTELFTNTGYNYLKYAEYKEIKSGENRASPHFSVSHLCYARDLRSSSDRAMLRLPVLRSELHDVTFELFAGDVMAVLYTKESEVDCLMEKLSGTGSRLGKTSGELNVNGHRLRKSAASRVIGVVNHDRPPPNLTVYQYLIACSKFCPPAVKHFGGTTHLMNQLISTLALAPLCDIRCGKLGPSELQRVKIAAQLIRDPQILVCKDICRELDVYDMAFLVDYLREWAVRAKRIAVLALAPPTIEILKMFSKVTILASGRVVYFGEPQNMLTYFDSINFPCPNFKNQCDYYVDLVTHDNLTSEASKESMARISRLAGQWAALGPTPKRSPGGSLPPDLPRSGPVTSFATLLALFWFEVINFPLSSFTSCFLNLLLSFIISICFNRMPKDRAGATQRFGLVKQMFYFATFPLLFYSIQRAQKQRRKLGMGGLWKCYGSFSYCAAKAIFDFPCIVLSALFFALPIYLITDFDPTSGSTNAFFSLFLLSFLHFTTTSFLVNFCAFSFKSFTASATLCVLIFSSWYLTSGFAVHFKDQAMIFAFGRRLVPTHWIDFIAVQHIFMGQPLLSFKASANVTDLLFDCERTRVLARKIKELPIYTVSTCAKISSRQILFFHGTPADFLATPITDASNVNFLLFGLLVLFAWILVLFCFTVLGLRLSRPQSI